MMAAESAVASTDRPSFNITLVHHPLEAIVPSAQEETKRRLFAFPDIILNGHVHSQGYGRVCPRCSGDSGQALARSSVVARCVFDEANKPQRWFSVSIVRA